MVYHLISGSYFVTLKGRLHYFKIQSFDQRKKKKLQMLAMLSVAVI